MSSPSTLEKQAPPANDLILRSVLALFSTVHSTTKMATTTVIQGTTSDGDHLEVTLKQTATCDCGKFTVSSGSSSRSTSTITSGSANAAKNITAEGITERDTLGGCAADSCTAVELEQGQFQDLPHASRALAWVRSQASAASDNNCEALCESIDSLTAKPAHPAIGRVKLRDRTSSIDSYASDFSYNTEYEEMSHPIFLPPIEDLPTLVRDGTSQDDVVGSTTSSYIIDQIPGSWPRAEKEDLQQSQTLSIPNEYNEISTQLSDSSIPSNTKLRLLQKFYSSPDLAADDAQHVEEVESLKIQLVEIRDNLDRIKFEHSKAREAWQQEIVDLQNQNRAATREISTLKLALKNKMASDKSKLPHMMEKELKDAYEDIDTLSKEYDILKVEYDALKEEHSILKDDHGDLGHQMRTRMAGLASLKAKLIEAENRPHDRENPADLPLEVALLQQEIEDLRLQVKEANEKAETALSDQRELQTMVDDKNRRILKLESASRNCCVDAMKKSTGSLTDDFVIIGDECLRGTAHEQRNGILPKPLKSTSNWWPKW